MIDLNRMIKYIHLGIMMMMRKGNHGYYCGLIPINS